MKIIFLVTENWTENLAYIISVIEVIKSMQETKLAFPGRQSSHALKG